MKSHDLVIVLWEVEGYVLVLTNQIKGLRPNLLLILRTILTIYCIVFYSLEDEVQKMNFPVCFVTGLLLRL